MDKEVVESLRLGTVLIIMSAVLLIGVLAFMLARQFGGEYFNTAAEQHRDIDIVGLSGLSFESGRDMPVASLYTILAREWRSVLSVTVTDTAGKAITVGKPQESLWGLAPALTNGNGISVERVSGPEQVLYAKAPNIYGERLEGRIYVTVVKDEATLCYIVTARRLQ